jgi:hypothetical protein
MGNFLSLLKNPQVLFTFVILCVCAALVLLFIIVRIKRRYFANGAVVEETQHSSSGSKHSFELNLGGRRRRMRKK